MFETRLLRPVMYGAVLLFAGLCLVLGTTNPAMADGFTGDPPPETPPPDSLDQVTVPADSTTAATSETSPTNGWTLLDMIQLALGTTL